MNYMVNRDTGGQSEGNHHCRYHVCSEDKIIETLPHIRGTCPKTELLRNTAHHNIRLTLADLFRMKNVEVYEEIHWQAMVDLET